MDGQTRYSAREEIRDLRYYLSILDDQTCLYESAADDASKAVCVREIASITKDMAFKCPTLRDPKLILARILSKISPPNKRKFVELIMLNWDDVTVKQTGGMRTRFRERIRVTLGSS